MSQKKQVEKFSILSITSVNYRGSCTVLFKNRCMKTHINRQVVHPGMFIFIMATIPNPDPREPSPDLTEPSEGYSSTDGEVRIADTEEDNEDPNTDLSGIKDDRTHTPEEAQADQEKKNNNDEPDLSGEINV